MTTLIGVIVGFTLAEGTRSLRKWLEIRKNKKVIKSELETILSQLPQKIDILNQGIEYLKANKVLPMTSVRTITIGYKSLSNDLYTHLSLHERNCLHVIYERVRIADEFMDTFETDLSKSQKDKTHDNIQAVYIEKVKDIIASYQIIFDLINSFIKNEPINVFKSLN